MTPPLLTSPLLDACGAAHGFFSRAGGVSQGIYTALNTGPGSDDALSAVAENRRRCAAALRVAPSKLLTLHQVHSPVAVFAEGPWIGGAPKADGQVTDRPGLALGVLSADCMPFLFIDGAAGVIGAAHAGWRGALGGVLEATVKRMTALGARPENIVGAIGPCLRQSNFEVGLDLVGMFIAKYPESDRFFAPGVSDKKRQFDLVGFGRWRLAQLGVDKLDDARVCTLGDSTHYFSCRASRIAGEADYGRNLSAISLPIKAEA